MIVLMNHVQPQQQKLGTTQAKYWRIGETLRLLKDLVND